MPVVPEPHGNRKSSRNCGAREYTWDNGRMVGHPEVGPKRPLVEVAPAWSPSVYRSIRPGVTQAHRDVMLSAAPKPETASANCYRHQVLTPSLHTLRPICDPTRRPAP